MKTYMLCCCILLTGAHSMAQVSNSQYMPNNYAGRSAINFADPSLVSWKAANAFDYTDINGNPYWKDEWNAALLILKNDAVVKIPQAKFNIFVNGLFYMNEQSAVLVADVRVVKRFVFLDKGDTSKAAAVFQNVPALNDKNDTTYYQVLNPGNIALLKWTKYEVKSDYDALKGRNENSFVAEIKYFLLHNGAVSLLKSLNERNIFAVINPTQDAASWLQKNNNKLKNENDITSFLNYYNTQNK